MKDLTDIEFLLSKEFNVTELVHFPGEEPFSADAIAYLNDLARILNKDPATKSYSDIATFAFFCRKANLLQLKEEYYPSAKLRKGRGIVFHITPSNVPTTFAYSFVSGILAGNVNIVKVSSKKSEQSALIVNAINELNQSPKHSAFASRLFLISCDHQSSATKYFSSICDVRIIWGDDANIKEIRKYTIPANAFDVTFASRYSLCVINADTYINEESPEQVASGFYNDTYLFDQNVCTSPHLIVWLGEDENVRIAKQRFWDTLYDLVKARYTFQPHSAVDKLSAFYCQASQSGDIKKTSMPDNLIWRVELKDLSEDIDNYRCNCGYFFEYDASSLSELSKIRSDKYQTLCYYGFQKEDLSMIITQIRPSGIDRIVPVGKTTDFSLTWNGYNLIDILSKEINPI